VTAEALDKLLGHDWPGNVRELRTCVFDAVNRFPDVEHLVPAHLRIDAWASGGTAVAAAEMQQGGTASSAGPGRVDLSALLALQPRVHFDPLRVADWAGRLREVQKSQALLLARYLLAALEATRRRTPEHPEGLLQITTAVKLMTGDASMKTPKAADVIKRLLKPLKDELDGDLREALSIAKGRRPAGGKPARSGS
jgi:DNA-binding NtrC family response regulator